jgi:branched-chain amino acid transport system substrate-binding protein
VHRIARIGRFRTLIVPLTRPACAVALDAESGRQLASVPLGTAPSDVAVGEGSVWVLDADDRTITQINATTRKVVRTFSTSSTPTDIAAGAGAVWIGNAPISTRSGAAEDWLPASISRLDPESGLAFPTIELPPAPGGHLYVFAGATVQHIAVSAEAVWVINRDLTVSRVDPRSNRIVARIEGVKARNIAAGDGDVWVSEDEGVAEIDPSTNTVVRRIRLDVPFVAGIAVGGGAVWVTDPEAGNVWRIDTGRRAMRTAIPLEPWVAGVSFGEGAVWVTNEIADTIHRIDPRTKVARRVVGAPSPRAVAADEGAVWVTTSSPPSKDADLPDAVCRAVDYGRDGTPDLLLVASLPLQGDQRQTAQSMIDGIRLVLDGRGYEAGAFTVGFQACDSSTAQAGSEDVFRCGSNAKAFARNLRVVGVFGSYFSPCSYFQIPIANRAAGGPLAMISPSNTHYELTEDDALYPSGTRSFFRLAAPDHDLGVAQVDLARQLGHRRVFLLTATGEEYGPRYPDVVRRHARQTGVDIVGTATFDADATSFSVLAQRVVRSRPQSVAIVGLLTPGTGRLIHELRAALGPKVALSAPDAFALEEDLRRLAGDAANGLYVTTYGIPNDRLPPRGRQLLAGVAATRGGDPGPDLAASYGAQAAEIFLDAIARSDGTRVSVTEQVALTDVRNGILGDVRFDRNGDRVEAPITILRAGDRGLDVDRVIVVRRQRSGSEPGDIAG